MGYSYRSSSNNWVKMFITLEKPSDVRKSSIALGELGTAGEAVETTHNLEYVPPKPLDMVGKN